MVQLRRRTPGWRLERRVRILHGTKLTVRLLAVRLPEDEAQQRRERVRREAKQRGRPVCQKKLELCAWNILVTNAPAELLGVEEAGVVRRVRWQIELVFKVFKSEGGIDQTRSGCPQRVQCELYAKLLAMVVQQWALLAVGYQMLRHRARRAARRVRALARQLGQGLAQAPRMGRAVVRLGRALQRRWRIVRRQGEPSTLDRLTELDPTFDQPGEAAREEARTAA